MKKEWGRSDMKILCIGDSNTYGYDPRSFLGSRYPEEIRWTDRLDNCDVINCGINGLTIPRDHPRYVMMIRNNGPDLVIVMLGTNDLFRRISAEEIAEQMERFIDSISSAGIPILLIAPPHLEPGDWVETGDIIEESYYLGDEYRELAERKGCLFADAGEWGVELTFDGVHFAPEGHETFARNLYKTLASYDIIS
ncbi:MAG: lipase [Mogibacterium sp.]|nr:lipase [Mogibacterium sp.]